MKFLSLFLCIFLFSFLTVFTQAKKAGSKPQVEFNLPKKPVKPPGTAEEFYEAARWAFLNTRDYLEALKLIDRAISLKSDFFEAFILRGHLKTNLKNCKGAVEDFDTVIKIDPNAVNAYQYRAECKIALKDLDGALKDFDESVRILTFQNKVQFNAFFKRGKLKYLLKDFNGAIEDFNRAFRAVPGPTPIVFRALTYLKMNETALALKDFKNLSDFYFQLTAESRNKFPELFKDDLKYPMGENPLAPPVKEKGQIKPGLKLVVSDRSIDSLTIEPNCKDCPQQKFAEFEDKINPDNWFFNQDKIYNEIYIMYDEFAFVFYLQGDLLERTGDLEGATEAFTNSILAKKYDAGLIRFRRGKLFLQLNRFEPAVRDFSWAIYQSKNLPEAYLERGIAILMLGREEIAQKDFDKYLKTKNSPEAQKTLTERVDAARKLRSELTLKK